MSVAVAREHAAIFYDSDSELIDALAELVVGGLGAGERVLALATASHRTVLTERLTARGLDVAGCERDGSLVLLDAATTLGSFLGTDAVDHDLFRLHVGRRIADAVADGTRLRVFGEMVTLLWDRGLVAAALELESHWNVLVDELDFSLLCAYPTTSLEGAPLADVHRVCSLHATLQPPDGYASHDFPSDYRAGAPSRLFLPVPEAVASVRRFVTRVLEPWYEPSLLDDAVLIVSELATNAVRHADSPFRVSLDRSADRVRIAVQDVWEKDAEEQQPSEDALGGRGLAIVGALTDRWGTEPLPTGKVVWAELHADQVG